MLKPGVSNNYLMSNNIYSKKQLEGQVNHYCKAEGINLSHYVYLMEINNNKNQKLFKFKPLKLSLGIFSMFSLVLIILYNLF